MSEDKHAKYTGAFFGKLLTVIAIPFVVYYCQAKPSEESKTTAEQKAMDEFRTKQNEKQESEAEAIRRKSREIIVNGGN